jgi:hypothetical protein
MMDVFVLAFVPVSSTVSFAVAFADDCTEDLLAFLVSISSLKLSLRSRGIQRAFVMMIVLCQHSHFLPHFGQ